MTINLEKELIKANKKLVTPAELLVLKEYDKHGELVNDDSLQRVGMANVLKHGNNIKTKAEALKAETTKFDQSRVFHISQIEETCMKYYLRFLPSVSYRGTIDKELPFKINAFEAAYEVKCQCDNINDRQPWQFYISINPLTGEQELKNSATSGSNIQNTFIMAPKESFELEDKPKDPLFFYKINEEYYYLIHKWGNDLNIGRRVMGFFSSERSWFLLRFWIHFSAVILGAGSLIVSSPNWWTIALLIANSFFLLQLPYQYYVEEERSALFKNNWRSPYND